MCPRERTCTSEVRHSDGRMKYSAKRSLALCFAAVVMVIGGYCAFRPILVPLYWYAMTDVTTFEEDRNGFLVIVAARHSRFGRRPLHGCSTETYKDTGTLRVQDEWWFGELRRSTEWSRDGTLRLQHNFQTHEMRFEAPWSPTEGPRSLPRSR